MYKLSKRSKKRLEGVHPDLIRLVEKAITNSPFDFGIPQYGGLRTVEDQQELYLKGRRGKKGERIVTYVDGIKRKSNHQAKSDGFGHAFDIYGIEDGVATWKPSILKPIAEHIKKTAEDMKIEISWGGDWTTFKDLPHFELK